MTAWAAYLTAILSPPCIAAGIAVIGCLIGKIRIAGVSLDMAGVLLAAVLYGAAVSAVGGLPLPLYSESLTALLQSLSSLGTALFLAAVGLMAGETVCGTLGRRRWHALLTGSVTVLTGAAVVLAIYRLDPHVGPSAALGLFAGALTSTPALAAAGELPATRLPELTAGYGAAYVFGVAGVVLFIQIRNRKAAPAPPPTPVETTSQRTMTPASSLILVFLTIVAGYCLGGITVPGIELSLGPSGGILASGLLLGGWCCRRHIGSSSALLPTLRRLGLLFFLIGMGVPAGRSLAGAARPIYILYGLAVTAAAVGAGWLCARLLRMPAADSSAAVCGGMTSTPAIGVLSDKFGGVDMSAYALAYTGALLTLLLSVRVLHAIFQAGS